MRYRFAHKTGVYGVEIVEESNDQVLVKVMQVIKHPKQGDLHHPNEVEGVFFHERKALSLYEKRFTTKSKLKPFEDEIMPYTDSLQQAITTLENKLNTSDTPFNQQSLACLEALKTDYARQYKINFD
ncbi:MULTISPECIES: kinase-associated lipoprotein B [Staphylococcus]|uniref:Kinase n=1 Tax=Staphylococcus chromogenes TaxID=46126 RepID=A0AAE5T0R1_STACR|nr:MULTISPECIES: kinase-associated lipoprotein B [Staphylococcus]KDP13741.1 kinase-associated protein B [Staphylococcus chromogenes MU 970]MBP0045329.1 kinase-associated lipoprotein B [Staphylococcus chromogenes]MBV5137629.1 kinase-associated lipoprotein B [Staphylococcus chromogenes]MBV5191046.1 kinase-associated lipoprotein B [Staphylococcus chromogenes]MBW3131713.1 kinase-associated lipoprotein B [Staphylococcus chromogenes]